MNLAQIEKLTQHMRKSLQEAFEYQKKEKNKKARKSLETASEIFKSMKEEGHKPSETQVVDLRRAAVSLGCTEDEAEELFFSGLRSPISANKNKNKAGASPAAQPVAPQPARSHPGYHPPPKTLPGFPDAKLAPRKTPVQGGGGLRKRWKDYKNKWIYEWDYQHGEVEKWDWSGKHHQGSYLPDGTHRKGPDNTKNPITPTIVTPMKSKMRFELYWFSPDTEELVGEEALPTLPPEKVAEWFFLPEGDPLTASYIVRASQRHHLAKLAKHDIDLNKFDYFLDGYEAEE